jgi:hypothetical protein
MTYKDAKELKAKYDNLWAFTLGNGFTVTGYDAYLKIIAHENDWLETFSKMREENCSNEVALNSLGLIDNIDLTVWLVTDPYIKPITAIHLNQYVRNNPEIFRNF